MEGNEGNFGRLQQGKVAGVAWCASCRWTGLELMPPTWYTVFPQLYMEVVAKGGEGKGCDFKLY